MEHRRQGVLEDKKSLHPIGGMAQMLASGTFVWAVEVTEKYSVLRQ